MTAAAQSATGSDVVSALGDSAAADRLLQKARDLIPSLKERSQRISQTRRVPDDVFNDLREAGFTELLKPRRYGGREFTYELVHWIARELGKGDGSTAWVYVVTAAHEVFMPLFPAAVQEQYWSSSRPVGASSYAPTGKVERINGTFSLSGKWSFCSGIDHAGWVMLGGICGMLEELKRPDLRYFLVPADEVKIVDDWHVMGLSGTGSKSIVLDNCRVPDERVITFGQIVAGRPAGLSAQEEYTESAWVPIGFSLAVPAPGIAQTAYELTVADLRRRYERRDPVFEAKKPAMQMLLAEASALIDVADLVLSRGVRDTYARIASRVRLTNEERVRNRRDSCYSIRCALEACQLLMKMSGGHGLLESNPIQRALRDIYAISAHPATNWESPSLSFGSVALGGMPTELML
jgi:alkylation response protein AidB-like acyl-CoA dehydrogenase